MRSTSLSCDLEHPGTQNVHLVSTPDGLSLRVRTWGDPEREVVLIVNAFGMPLELVTPLAETLSQEFRVLSWECRGLPGPVPGGSAGFGTSAHVDDLECVLDHFSIPAARWVVGWCTGARIGLHFADKFGGRVGCLALISGAYSFSDLTPAPFQKQMDQLLAGVLKRPDLAELLCESQTLWGTRSTSTEEKGPALASYPFASGENLIRYARLCSQSDASDLALTVPHETLIVTGEDDPICPAESSQRLASTLPRARYVSLENAGHYLPYTHHNQLAAEMRAQNQRQG